MSSCHCALCKRRLSEWDWMCQGLGYLAEGKSGAGVGESGILSWSLIITTMLYQQTVVVISLCKKHVLLIVLVFSMELIY